MRKGNLFVIIEFILCFAFLGYIEINAINLSIQNTYLKNKIEKLNPDLNNGISLSFVGDCTLGTNHSYKYQYSFHEKYNILKDDNYFFGGVKEVLGNDNLSIANLEGVLTDRDLKLIPKEYNYKGPTKYANILKKGSIEMVNVANNHTYDYGESGFNDTIKALNKAGVLYFGYNDYQIVEIKGIRIGIAGFGGWDYSSAKNAINKAIKYFNEMNVQIKIFNFHWGQMRVHNHNKTQEQIGKYAIDKGADLVIGHHSHVLQGIEKYKGKYIAYSLGNFVYGGITYPYDSDSVILQMNYEIEDGKVVGEKIHLVPVSITSSGILNDYRPKILVDSERKRVLNKILKYSTNFAYNINE